MKRMISLLFVCILCQLCTAPDMPGTDDGGQSGSEPVPDGSVKLYDAPAGLASNVKGSRHKVSIDGQECFVYRTEATGGGREYGSVYPEYVYFDYENEGRITVEVTANYDLHSVEILPSRHSITPDVEGRCIRFDIIEPGQYFVKTNGDHSNGNTSDYNLYVFANPKEKDIPDPEDPDVIWFRPGVYSHQDYFLESGKTYYIEGGAFVYGRFYAEGVKNVRICGRGTLCGERLTDMGDPGRTVCLKNGCSDITVEGINIMHSKVWQVAFYQSENIHVDNVHAISHGQSSDGIDITGCRNVLVENSFFRGHDDILAVKAKVWGAGQAMDCQDVTFRNCVIWSDSSNPMTIGYETDQNVRNILYENIDVLSMSMPPVWQLEAVMAIEPHADISTGSVSDVTYRDIRIDLAVPQNSLFRFSVDKKGGISNISLDNIFVNYGGTMGGLLYGDPDYYVDNIFFNNVRNSDGEYLSDDRIKRNSYVGNVSLSPYIAENTIIGETWDFSTEFGGYSNIQGGNNWYYKAMPADGDISEMRLEHAAELSTKWSHSNECYILRDRTDTPAYGDEYSYWPKWSAGLMSSMSAKACLVWKAPATGTVRISGKARKWQDSGDGVILTVGKNSSDPFTALGIDSGNNGFVNIPETERPVNKGDEIRFTLDPKTSTSGDFTQIIPVITYIGL